jgi:hypothetical protein
MPTDQPFRTELLELLLDSSGIKQVSRDFAASTQGVATATVELTDSTGEIIVRVPDQTTGSAAALVLKNPLDPNLSRIKTKLGERLAQTHAAIGARHQTEYTDTIEHESNLLRASLPLGYDSALVIRTLTQFRRASIEADRCHQLVWTTFEAFESP